MATVTVRPSVEIATGLCVGLTLYVSNGQLQTSEGSMALLRWWRVRVLHLEGVRSKGRFLIERSVHLLDTGKLGGYFVLSRKDLS
jgi:hypothetical protein